MKAVKRKHLDKAKELLAADPYYKEEINLPDKNGSTAIYHPAWNEDLDMLRLLIEYGADVQHRLYFYCPNTILQFSDFCRNILHENTVCFTQY